MRPARSDSAKCKSPRRRRGFARADSLRHVRLVAPSFRHLRTITLALERMLSHILVVK